MAFDADDTLWDCQSHFDKVERDYAKLLSAYADEEEVSRQLFETETKNMPLLGYGAKAFTLSLVENAVRVSQGRVSAEEIARIVDLGKSLLQLSAEPLPGVEATLRALQNMGKYHLAVLTKGELSDQEGKLRRSGLELFFDAVSIVSTKTQDSFLDLCNQFSVPPSALCMVGNSLPSDITPALAVGGAAIHIPFHTQWAHETAEPFEHPMLRTVERFEEIMDVLG